MRVTRRLSISIGPTQLLEARRLARREHRSVSELVRDALHRYQREQIRGDALTGVSALAKAVERLRDDAARNGASRLTKAEMEAEIRAVRNAGARKTPIDPVK